MKVDLCYNEAFACPKSGKVARQAGEKYFSMYKKIIKITDINI